MTKNPPNNPAKTPPGNPIAVALHHDTTRPNAPTVVASGTGAVAEKILSLAFANDIKVRQDPDLAQMLLAVELDSEIPLAAFSAVALILARLYEANRHPIMNQAINNPGFDPNQSSHHPPF
ncbi:MAG: flagellar protein FhlB [Alphaproteobacteria bacterium]|nr:flagellar protein FhlB [Alphaproteobacteria bacterium]